MFLLSAVRQTAPQRPGRDANHDAVGCRDQLELAEVALQRLGNRTDM